MDDPRAAKRELRDRMREVRAAISLEERERVAREVERRLFALPEMASARRILLFYSVGSEIPTGGMASRALAEGKEVLLPYVEGDAMEAAVLRPGAALERGPFGPKEPVERLVVDPDAIDVVVAPGLAFDGRGHRLGYGGGHYDRFLSRVRPDAVRIGIGFAGQLVERVPDAPGDERVHLVVTDAGVVDCRRP